MSNHPFLTVPAVPMISIIATNYTQRWQQEIGDDQWWVTVSQFVMATFVKKKSFKKTRMDLGFANGSLLGFVLFIGKFQVPSKTRDELNISQERKTRLQIPISANCTNGWDIPSSGEMSSTLKCSAAFGWPVFVSHALLEKTQIFTETSLFSSYCPLIISPFYYHINHYGLCPDNQKGIEFLHRFMYCIPAYLESPPIIFL